MKNKRSTVAIALIIAVAGLGILVFRNENSSVSSSRQNETVQNIPTKIPSNEFVKVSNSNIITLTSNGFSPSIVALKTGAKVTWINNSGKAATVNSGETPVHSDYEPLNLGVFKDGKSLELVFDKPGTYKYHNHLSHEQKGTIIIKDK